MFAMTILGLTITTIWTICLLVLWVAIAFWPASIAKSKGYSFLGWFILSLFFWWITLFVVLFLPDRTAQ
jgi:hypothetical protein